MNQITPTLIPINLHNPDEFSALQTQRQQCGWDFTDNALLAWRQKQDAQLKSFFWITIPSSSSPSDGPIRAGHISLDSYADPPDQELAREDRHILTIQNFFVAPQYRAFGVGRAAMDQLEAMATQEPYGSRACQYLAVTTKTKRYYYDEDAPGIEGTGIWAATGEERPKFSTVDWYERRGYVCWKSEARWPTTTTDGHPVMIVADFMRKGVSAKGQVNYSDDEEEKEKEKKWWWSWGILSLSVVGLAVVWWRRK
ncbi:hypothetical protein FE257_010595 [Aspergillus nanangensis]|uniref:N-acetyltransferase domain-containing protein n=1 Tax=Aspergillus nanangensis TaxID=2582783 RepID=A0AAD4CIJ1_ASPNN|nr:hypothetical protein FE257_010595 [Aspergillus nanangensis]